MAVQLSSLINSLIFFRVIYFSSRLIDFINQKFEFIFKKTAIKKSGISKRRLRNVHTYGLISKSLALKQFGADNN